MTSCRVCGSQRITAKFEVTKGHRVCQCGECELQFLSPQLTEGELQKLYSESYYASWGVSGDGENEVTRRMKMATFRLRLALIRKFVGGGRILDVGCATGYFLEVAREQGYDPYGVEFSAYAADVAQRKFGAGRIHKGILETFPQSEGSFNAIAMSDLIEHVRDPRETLIKARSLLAPDGVILLMTPDTGALSNRLMGRRWTHYKPEHFFYFNERAMGRMAKQCGFEVVWQERCKKALTFDYLQSQFQVYRHWLLTPAFSVVHRLLPAKVTARNFYFSIGEMVVILKKAGFAMSMKTQ